MFKILKSTVIHHDLLMTSAKVFLHNSVGQILFTSISNHSSQKNQSIKTTHL
jgi:hypothetical protein